MVWEDLFASSFALSYSVTILVTSLECGPVNFSKVSEACFLEVVRALGIVALVFLTITFSGLMAIFVTLFDSSSLSSKT